MSHELAPASAAAPRRRSHALELVVVAALALAVLLPGIWNYTLVDPWETHYGEVARMMLQNDDWVHTDWPGGMGPTDHEGFRSKPVLAFWSMAASLRASGLAAGGGYSGEMVQDGRVMFAIRLPFVLAATAGLTLLWWMLARLISRRMAWLGLLVVGSTPFFAMVARQAIPDMLLVSCVIGALSMFVMAMEDGDRPLRRLFTIRIGSRDLDIDARHVFVAIVGGFLLAQLVYYVSYFTPETPLAVRRFPNPRLFFPLVIVLLFGGIWQLWRLPFMLAGGLVAMVVAALEKRGLLRAVLDEWDRYAPDRYLVRGLAFPVVWAFGYGWSTTDAVADRVLRMAPLATMRQVFLLWCYAFLGVSVLAKGPPGLAVVGLVGVLYVVLFARWRELYEGRFELKRGILLMVAIFLPWHVGMYLTEGLRFIDEYVFTHVLNRAAVGVDNSPGTSGYYVSQIGHGMWLWAALLPPALAASLLRSRKDTREGRVRLTMTLWATCAVFFFFVVQTKFHHYILPSIPALALVVAFFLDDLLARRDRLHPLYAALGVGIVLLVCRDLVWEPDRWIEMFVFRYDRPWPAQEPWQIDPSDGFLGLGAIAAVAIVLAALPWRRLGITALGGAGLAICLWSLHVYMPDAATHWGMRDAIRSYYAQRTIYGQKLVYFTPRQLADDWRDVRDRWRFETFIPDTLHVGQPVTIRVQLQKVGQEKVAEHEVAMIGTVAAIGHHHVDVALPEAERAKVQPLVELAARQGAPPRARRTVRVVDADRLIAWQLYWRGENFWSSHEMFGWLPETRTGFNKTDNVEFLKYLNDRTRAPLGRRYFLITEAGRANSVRALLPTTRARESFEIVNTTSNKFTLVSFYL